MKNKADQYVKLGLFVIGGAAFLFILLFMIGKNKNMFGNTYTLKVHVRNAQGLVSGNNVRYAGIQAGTVKSVSIINDSTIEVSMSINKRMKDIIRSNARVSIGTEGLVGNKVVNIVPGTGSAALAGDDELLVANTVFDTDQMLKTLQGTNEDIASIAAELKQTIARINTSRGLWSLLDDESLPRELRMSAANIRAATAKANNMAGDLESIVAAVKQGKGSVGMLLTDSSFADNLDATIIQVRSSAKEIEYLSQQVNTMVSGLKNDLDSGNGPLQAMLRDTALVNKLSRSLDNIQKGTDGFNQNMEALKHNFLFRGYFRKQERKEKKLQQVNGDKVVLSH